MELYTYKWTVVKRGRDYVSGCLRSPGSAIPVNLHKALQLVGATTAAAARDEVTHPNSCNASCDHRTGRELQGPAGKYTGAANSHPAVFLK